jgi:amino acid adenylation domain-containing protein
VPLSFAQQRLWFLDQLMPGTPLFNISYPIPLGGEIDEELLERSVNATVQRHESLRTVFTAVDGEPLQEILPEIWIELQTVDLRMLPEADRELEASRLMEEDAERAFDLAAGPLLRTTLIHTGRGESILCVVVHHIVFDAWSADIFWRDLFTIWESFERGEPSPLPAPALQYADFCLWERERLTGSVLDDLRSYWKEQLAGAPVLELPTDRPRPPVQSGRGAAVYSMVASPVIADLKALAQQERATLFMVLLAAFQTLLHRYTGQTDVVVGTYTANRHREELEDLIGFFVNTLPLRADLFGRPTFRQLLTQVRETALDAFEHQDLPFARLIQELSPERDLSRNPLSQIAFQLLNTAGATAMAQESGADIRDRQRKPAVLDLTLTTWECAEGLRVELEYDTDLYDARIVKQIGAYYGTLLASIAADPDGRVDELPLAGEDVLRHVVEAWNQTRRAIPADDLVALFEAQVARTPDAVALRCGGDSVSYAALNRRVNRVARHLRALGVREETLVAVCMGRSIELVVAFLAIFKAGGAYLPLDPSYPAERLARMLVEAAPAVVIGEPRSAARLPQTGAPVVDVATCGAEAPEDDLGVRTAPDALAYVIYTSGSTGGAKGIAVEHRQILNRLHWMWEAYPFAEDEVACQKTALNFVDSLWELLGPLLRGVPSVIVPDDVVKDPLALVELLAEHDVSRIWLVPSLLRVLLDTQGDLASRLPRLTMWVASGEPLTTDLAEQFEDRLPHAVLYNLYGTSEVWDATWYDPRRDGPMYPRVPIGRPIANVRTYVLDKRLQALPPGVPGELYVGGVGLGRGYLASPGLTAERFIPDPFGDEPGARLYRSGDIVRCRDDGNLEFLGRSDQQVKLRGFRIELGEIDAALRALPPVRQAAAQLREDELGEPRLVAYVVPDTTAAGTVQAGALRRMLRRTLPEYMVPTEIVSLSALPLTASGKLDRRALPPPQGARASLASVYVAPTTSVEIVIASMWCELLGVDRVGIHDSFFELGGHSLLGIRCIARLRDAFRLDIPLRTIFERPTVAGLGQLVAEAQMRGETDDTPAIFPRSRAAARHEA